jgi:predicted ferric reductase
MECGREGMKAYLAGERPLWKAFWFLFGGGYVMLLGLNGAMLGAFHGSAAFETIRTSLALLFVAFVLACMTAVWRCARNVGWPGWTWIARIVMVYVMFVTLRSTHLMLQP